MEISVGKLLCLMQPPVNQLLIPPWLWMAMTLSVVTPSSAARVRFYPPDDSSASDEAVGSWWSRAFLAAGVLALAAVVGVIYFFSSQPKTHWGTYSRCVGSDQSSTRHRRGTERPAAGTRRTVPSQENSRLYAYEHDDIDKATNRFDEKKMVGQGRAGEVYRGKLTSNEGKSIGVAVKRFHNTLISDQTIDAVKDRVKSLVKKPHQNVVRVHGAFSKVGSRLCVVYDLMPEGSLDKHLFVRKASLSMARRCNIIRDVAHGLKHLHSHDILHGSVKASNILLEDNFNRARVGDFHFFLLDQPRCKGHPSTAAGGSRPEATAYIFPECSSSNRPVTETAPTYEMDVFCFGVVVLEVISGRQANHKPSWFLVDMVRDLYQRGRILDVVVDQRILDGTIDTESGRRPNRDEAERLLRVGLACSHQEYSNTRPSMRNVVEILAERMPPPNI